jgi:hypothetical protein
MSELYSLTGTQVVVRQMQEAFEQLTLHSISYKHGQLVPPSISTIPSIEAATFVEEDTDRASPQVEDIVDVYIKAGDDKELSPFMKKELNLTANVPSSRKSINVSIPRTQLDKNSARWKELGYQVEESKKGGSRKRSRVRQSSSDQDS